MLPHFPQYVVLEKRCTLDTEIDGQASVTVRLLNNLVNDEIQDMRRQLLSIAADGKIDESEKAGTSPG